VGGAGRAAFRLHTALLRTGVRSKLLVQKKTGDDEDTESPASHLGKGLAAIKPHLEHLPLFLYPRRRKAPFHVQWTPGSLSRAVGLFQPDLLHLHWICDGLVRIESLTWLQKPIVWTLHDMWPFTGGCHYGGGCLRYEEDCGRCPQLGSGTERDLSRWVWQRKRKAWRALNLTLVSPSRWLAECASRSSLFRDFPMEVIPNGVDLEVFKPLERKTARKRFGLHPTKPLLLFGAMDGTRDPRKGYHLFMEAARRLHEISLPAEPEMVVFGSQAPTDSSALGFRISPVGVVQTEEAMANLYSAVDLYVAPSTEENLANTIVEALSCGTPCVAFHIGGMPDMIVHRKNGYLARPLETDDLARGIQWSLEDAERWKTLSLNARKTAEERFDILHAAKQYAGLFNQILNS